MPAANIIQLKALLSEKFPGLRMRLEEPRAAGHKVYPTGLPQIDETLHGGFPRGALSEIIVPAVRCGSALLIRALLQQAARANGIVAFIDGSDTLEVTSLDGQVLSRLLWLRCQTPAEAIKAADLVLRDGNLPLVLMDLQANSENQLRKISAATWYRFQRLVEETGAACIVFTPRRMLSPAMARLTFQSHFTLAALERDEAELLCDLKIEATGVGKQAEFPQMDA